MTLIYSSTKALLKLIDAEIGDICDVFSHLNVLNRQKCPSDLR